MNRVSGWAERLSWAVLIMLVTLPAHAQLMLAHEGHHSGDCVIKGGAFSVNFSAYEKPKGDIPPMHAFCQQIPATGIILMSVDLNEPESRKLPLAVRVVMEGHGPNGHEVLSLPPKIYPSGSISLGEVNMADLGQYVVLLETEEDGAMKEKVRIPLTVGEGGGHGSHGSGPGLMEVAVFLAAAGIGAFLWLRRRKPDTKS
jgi:hypothetical protein